MSFLYYKHKPQTSHSPWAVGLVEYMNRSIQKYIRCFKSGNDSKWSTDVKTIPINSFWTITIRNCLESKTPQTTNVHSNFFKNAQGYY